MQTTISSPPEIPPRVTKRGHLAVYALVIAGFAALAISLAADSLMGGARGFGGPQLLLFAFAPLAWGLAAGLRYRLACNTAPEWLEATTDTDRRSIIRFSGLVLQVAALVLVARALQLESEAFFSKILPLVCLGFFIHHLLPQRFRLGFFLTLSWIGVLWVFGVANGAWLIGLGVVLIAICHLPLAFSVRVCLLAGAGLGLALLRGGVFDPPWSGAIWPIFGSMFMFRLIAYMYDLRHSKEKPNWARAGAYFFLLPNIVFPLFPVVDYATFRRTYFDQDALRIYQQGIRWMATGFCHLLLYRVVYHRLTLSPADVNGLRDVVQYVVANFGLYLRVSGQFHLIVGMLHLFGFRLPETHRFFFLASSFTDFWRRINIYWKDFMMKVVYYPVYFRVRRRGDTVALVVSTLFVFFVTWATHSYQWFWLLGTVLLSWTDTLFWAILAVLLVGNSLYEAKHGRKRAVGNARRTSGESLALGARIVATFSSIAVLWALWTSPTLDDWRALWSGVRPGFNEIAALFGIMVTAIALIWLADRVLQRRHSPVRTVTTGAPFGRAFALSTAVIALLWVAGRPLLLEPLAPAAPQLVSVLRDARDPDLNRADAAHLQRGYYENLTGVNRFNSRLWEVYSPESAKAARNPYPHVVDAGLAKYVDDIRIWELRPLLHLNFKGALVTTNRWGMRDRDYDLAPPANTYRIAMQGASFVMGYGVPDHEPFEVLLEKRINEEIGSSRNVEILNFAVTGYGATEQAVLFETKVLRFKPNALFYVAHVTDGDLLPNILARAIDEGRRVPYPELRAIAERAHITPEMGRVEMVRRLKPYREEMLRFAYDRIGRLAKENNIKPVWLLATTPDNNKPELEPALLAEYARNAGFRVLDVTDAYDGHDADGLTISPGDKHPNGRGHELLANRIYQALYDCGILMTIQGL